MANREQNERNFPQWIDFPGGGRRYWRDVAGRLGSYARYVKEVDVNEQTTKFYQEIYNSEGILIEVHEKFPFDRGHQKVN